MPLRPLGQSLARARCASSRIQCKHANLATAQSPWRFAVRALSDAVDPSLGNGQRQQQSDDGGEWTSSSAASTQLNGYAAASTASDSAESTESTTAENESRPFRYYDDEDGDDDEPSYDIDFTAQRMGFPISDPQEDRFYFNDDIREETRAEATLKAERILAILRNSMTEIDIGKVIHRVAQFSTLPRVTGLALKQFKRSLENKCGPAYKKEFEYLMAFLEGRDEVIDTLELQTRDTDGESKPEFMGLHPEVMADPKLMSIVFIYCRYACLNALQLIKNPANPSPATGAKTSSLWQVKRDYRRVLDIEGLSQYADMMGLEKDDADDDAHPLIDPEWEEFNLENNRIDFRDYNAELSEFISTMKELLSDQDISKMLVAMLASVKTSKLHRKIFQEMICNIQTVLPEDAHEVVLSRLVPFLSGNAATLKDFDSITSSNALQHHRYRHEAILRSLLECRMRCGHILITDLDELDEANTVGSKLTPEQRQKVRTAAWNIVSVLDDRRNHVFFSRFLRYKLAWRPNRSNFDDTFLDNVRLIFAPHDDLLMPLFEETYQDLSVETLTICRVKSRHARRLIRHNASLKVVNEQGERLVATEWLPERSVFYSNLPFKVSPQHLRDALSHIGAVRNFMFFSHPVDGAPDEKTVKKARKRTAKEDVEDEDVEVDGESDAVDGELDVEDDELLDDELALLTSGDDEQHDVKKKLGRPKDSHTPKKNMIIASNMPTQHSVLVEFESTHARDRALQRALQIFGVMMEGWKEHRAVFSTGVEKRRTLSLQHIPFGTTAKQVTDQVNEILREVGLAIETTSDLPPEAIVANGRMELRFESFAEAAQVMGVLQQALAGMARRSPLTPEEVTYQNKRSKVRAKHEIEAGRAKRRAERVARKYAKDHAGDEDWSEQDEINDANYTQEWTSATEKVDPYMEVDELQLAAEEIDARCYRPFEVTWNRPRKQKNKHLYV
ncbi:TPA: hypothetical protein N0F65_006754 [Lagenidium giganteum]|uniref:Uncharacterized protein n=1 Tax=Lagenidium giganteum TaxID=4803 RepID=A0AAV2YUK6_9STRA|nr:TPA: hypothetical protein N0F65_006754 [Lagenidium giganteum]